MAARHALVDYYRELIAKRRAAPREDMLSALIAARGGRGRGPVCEQGPAVLREEGHDAIDIAAVEGGVDLLQEIERRIRRWGSWPRHTRTAPPVKRVRIRR